MCGISELIRSIYTDQSCCDYIVTDFVLTKENEVVAQGKAKIKKYSNTIDLLVDSFTINSMKIASNNIGRNTVIIDKDEFPQYFSCELINFPLDNRIDCLKNKEIIVKIPKVKISGELVINMGDMDFTFSILPLCSCAIICT